MNNNILQINIYDEINIIDIFCSVKNIIKKVSKKIKKLVKNIVINILFGGVNNYSNPPNKLTRTKLDESLKFSFAFVLYN